MSANLKVETYTNPEALLVPFNVLKPTQQGYVVFKMIPGATQPEKVTVSTGVTTPTAVEITSGLSSGDKLLYLNP